MKQDIRACEKSHLLSHLDKYIITGRNEVLAKVMFLHVSVILLTGGEGSSKFSGAGGYFGGVFLGGFLQIFGGGYFLGGFLQIFGGGWFSPRIRSTFGRYASYWNAFLFQKLYCTIIMTSESDLNFSSLLRDGSDIHSFLSTCGKGYYLLEKQ